MVSNRAGVFPKLPVGSRVRIRESHRAPYSGHHGILAGIDTDPKGAFVVRFDDGTQFRYNSDELESVPFGPQSHSGNHLIGRIMKSHFHTFSISVVLAGLILSACGPAPNPKLQANNQPQEQAAPAQPAQPAVAETKPAPVAEAPAPAPAPRPRREAPVERTSARPAPAPRAVVAPRPAAAPEAAPSNADGHHITLPAPIATIAPPAPPAPVDEVRPERVERVEPPAPRKVKIPSGTLVGVRMIDAVDSETAKVGDTFKASLDSAIVVDDETVFPAGSDVYVKLVKVDSAGRVSGRSEVQLQLDKIFLGRQSYLLESNKYVSTGASQGGRTARSAGLGAAIGAAIGAISGGGKGAVIGGATGAGAGAGVEAIRKGEQVRVDSETRLDFRLEQTLEVTLQSPSSNSPQRNNPPAPLRFGTRQ